MRILIFSLAYFPFVGGAEVAVREITDRLTDYDFDLISVNLDGKQKKNERISRINVYRLPSKYFFPFSACRLARKLHREKNYQIVWAIMANQAGMAAAHFKHYLPSVPFLLTLQEGDELTSWSYRLRLLAPRFFGVFRLADQVQAISNYLADWAKRMGAKVPVTVVPNGVDPSGFQVLGSSLQVKKDKEKIIIHTGRLVKKNGVDILIESLRFLDPKIKLQILGTGPLESELKLQATSYKLQARVEFLGHVPPDQVAEYLAKADIFVRPSRSEGLGNSFLEAMAVGVPVIGTAVGGIPDFLKGDALTELKASPREQTGWLCEVDNPRSVADKVQYILNPVNCDHVFQVITRAKKLIEEKYDWDKIVRQMGAIIASLG